MGIKIYNKTSAGRRFSSVNDFAELTDKRRQPAKRHTEHHQHAQRRDAETEKNEQPAHQVKSIPAKK